MRPRLMRDAAEDLVGSLFLQLVQGRLGQQVGTGVVGSHVNQCFTSSYDCRVAISLMRIEVFPCLSHGRRRPALLPYSHA